MGKFATFFFERYFSSFPIAKLFTLGCTIILVGCATQPAPIVDLPSGSRKTVAPHKPAAKIVPAAKPESVVTPVSPKPTIPKALTGVALLNSLLPSTLVDRSGWAADIFSAFEALKLVPSNENICAILAEIEQESSFQADPVVPGLKNIVRRELETRRNKYNIPQWIMDSGLDVKAPDGRSYNERIDALKTENDVNILFDDITSEVPFGKKLLADYNPVHTGGPMQVSLAFANAYVAAKPYPYVVNGTLRNELFSRKGGLYFGIGYLLDYPADYASMNFRFADFNSGQYSSRNAAFQNALHFLSGLPLEMDGDLLRYQNGVALEEPSQTMQALLSISSRLNMDKAEIFRDLLLEKSADFEQSQLYKKTLALSPSMPRALIPEIVLNTPKTTRKLTTASYAKQVNARYLKCLKKI